jgi:hypothetical protein
MKSEFAELPSQKRQFDLQTIWNQAEDIESYVTDKNLGTFFEELQKF